MAHPDDSRLNRPPPLLNASRLMHESRLDARFSRPAVNVQEALWTFIRNFHIDIVEHLALEVDRSGTEWGMPTDRRIGAISGTSPINLRLTASFGGSEFSG